MIFGSVCSGIEAASTAWEPLGWRGAWFSEIEPFPSAVLAHHWPETPNLGDFTTIRDRIASWEVPAPEVLVGGTPCQAFSVAGLRQSMGDSRGQLTLEFVRLANGIDAARSLLGIPECIVVWENVPGVLNTPDNAFGCFLAGLAGEDDPLLPPGGRWSSAGRVLGPSRAVAWRILDAQYFGVAQRRRRVFVVASAREGFDPTEVLFEFDGVRRDSPPRRETGKGFASVAGTLAASGGGMERPAGNANELDFCVPVSDVAATLRSGSTSPASHGKLNGTDRAELVVQVFGGNRCSGPIDIAPALNASASASGRLDFESEAFVAIGLDEEQNATEDFFGTLKARTKGGGFEGTVAIPSPASMQVRRLTPTECERLQGFPDGHTRIPWPVVHDLGVTQCRKRVVRATVLTKNGKYFVATNHIRVDPGICPRSTVPTGEGYDLCSSVCGQEHHAEVRALRLAGKSAKGATLYVEGHTYACEACLDAARRAGIAELVIGPPPIEDCPDGPRYKALGNSMAVPVMRWIGERIERFHG
jgi:DNA (cytosine-5)-methyltransferase 1